MHSLFTPVDTLDTTTFLHSVVQPNKSFDLRWVMPVTGLESNGAPVGLPPDYGLYLTINASGVVGQTTPTPIASSYNSINVTLWADPMNDAGTASSTVENGAAFSGNTANHIVLATGTMVSGKMSVDADGVRHATYVESLKPTLDGTLLLGGSIKQGDLLTEQFTTQPNEFQVVPPPVRPGDTSGNSVNLVNGGSATVTLSDQTGQGDTIFLRDIPLKHHPALTFIHY